PRGTCRFLSAHFFARRNFRGTAFLPGALYRVEQSLTRQLAIHCLGARILHGDTDAARRVPQGHGGGNLVHVLTTWPGGPGKGFSEIGFPKPEPIHSALGLALSHSDGIFSKTQASFHASADK